ncbi:B3 domain-containing protein [Platanthera guangdongensis]|uniref:B3 domain-containing protein n=1 Tax=Platanthera guangdongensis TaxID=2320717 RepID=A0ABR2LMZ7_9ASPA
MFRVPCSHVQRSSGGTRRRRCCSHIVSKMNPKLLQLNCCQKAHEERSSLSTQESDNADPICARSSLTDRSTTPLSGTPYFTSVVVKSQIQSPYQMVIPRRFNKSLPDAALQVVLTRKGKAWKMKYLGEGILKRFGCGWKEFALDNHLKVGDGCVFELMARDDNEMKLQVQILDGQLPSGFVTRGCADKPIFLD